MVTVLLTIDTPVIVGVTEIVGVIVAVAVDVIGTMVGPPPVITGTFVVGVAVIPFVEVGTTVDVVVIVAVGVAETVTGPTASIVGVKLNMNPANARAAKIAMKDLFTFSP